MGVFGTLLIEETLTYRPVSGNLQPKLAELKSEPAPDSVVETQQCDKRVLSRLPGFLSLFTSGPRLLARSTLFASHCLMEGKVLQDQVSVLQIGECWPEESRSRWTSGLGLAILGGAQIVKPCVEKLGEHGFTALCHGTSVAAF